jgi:hypothetical protein
VVTGNGEDVTGIWLEGAGEGLGVPIPTRIAHELRGRKYSSFSTFRKAFWRAVVKDVELSAHYESDIIERMKRGNAPVVRYSDSAGDRWSYEIHHIEWISKGGAVYDIDNLRVTTPKNHIESHRGTNDER